MREVYLDNSATTPVLPEVAAVMHKIHTDTYGNPSSLHRMGVEAEKIKRRARRTLADACSVKESEIYFTSGGTEANNLAVMGVARRLRRRGLHLVTTQVEHPSVLYACRLLEQEGFALTYLPVDREGIVSPAAVADAMRADTLLVSVMHVNNEVGAIQPLAEIGALIKKNNSETLFHVDAVQSFGKLPVQPLLWQADLVTFSAHKLHGPKGVGALYKRQAVHMEPFFHGGGQEDGLRPGTENMAGIGGFAEAARLATAKLSAHALALSKLKKNFSAGILAAIPDICWNSSEEGAPHILNISVAGTRGEVLVHALAEEGVYISTGAACHSRRPELSHVLLAMGRKEKDVEAALRFSFSPLNTEEALVYALEKLQAAVLSIRRVTRR
ncbi:MAG: cysteine desulfurase [Dethiobacter sp.]|nr:cysteine desulfurase [Dethiobacter sp.]MBS3901873.1 cysteine desulfurase [Dethiobacter sp.]MBS3988932.1 cysteine desulfurase [Dethiobacter sp.]